MFVYQGSLGKSPGFPNLFHFPEQHQALVDSQKPIRHFLEKLCLDFGGVVLWRWCFHSDPKSRPVNKSSEEFTVWSDRCPRMIIGKRCSPIFPCVVAWFMSKHQIHLYTVRDCFQHFARDIKSPLEAKSNETRKETWLLVSTGNHYMACSRDMKHRNMGPILPWTNLDDVMVWRIVSFLLLKCPDIARQRKDKVSFTKWHFPTWWLRLFLCCPDGCSEPFLSRRAPCPGGEHMVPDRLFGNWVVFFVDSQQQDSGAIQYIADIKVHV